MADLADALMGLNFSGDQSAYGIGQQALAQSTPSLINPYGSTGQALGISLGSVLLQSLLGYQAQKSAMEDTLATNKLANAMLRLKTPEERTSFIETQATDPRIGSRLSSLATALTGQDLLRKQLIDQEVARQEALGQFELGPVGSKLFQRQIDRSIQLENARRSRLIGPGRLLQAPLDVGKEPLETPLEGSLADRRDALIEYAVRTLKMTPNRALDYAEKNLAVDAAANRKATKRIEDSRNRALLFDEITSTARAGVDAAGMTGGALGGLRQAASRAAAVFSPEQQAKQDATKLLDSVKPDIVKIGRSPGAVTERENQILIGAGPSSANTPSENEKIIRKMEVISDLEQEYADFIESYISRKGSAVGADSLWMKYKEQEVFKNGRYNENRVPIYDFLTDVTTPSPTQPAKSSEQKLLDAGFVRGPKGGWIKP